VPLETLSKLLCCFTHLEELRFKVLEAGNEIVVLIMSDEKQLDGHRLGRRHEERAGECECLELLGPQTMARMDTTKDGHDQDKVGYELRFQKAAKMERNRHDIVVALCL
jgi:hypothetical protein